MSVIRHPSTGTAVTVKQWRYTATGGETTLSGTDGFGLSLSYTVGAEEVYINGVLLVRGTDYTASTGTSITGLTALVAGDVATVMSANSFNVANAIAASTVTAKGDLIVANGASSVSNLAVGADGTTLVANSSSSTGVAWAGPAFVAGKNKIINGDFGVWQRGTSFSPTYNAFTADRWIEDATTAYPTSQTISQQTFTPGSAPVAGYEGQYYLQFAYTYAAGNGGQFLSQRIENVQTLAGQTATLSFWVKVASAASLGNAVLIQNFGSGGSGSVTTTVGAASATTSWQRVSFTVSIPSIAGKTVGAGSYLDLRIFMPTASSTTSIWGVQLEAGSVATAFQTATGTVQGELAACQRYYWRTANNGGAYQMIGRATAFSGTQADLFLSLPVTMRTSYATIDYNSIALTPYAGTGTIAVTAVTAQTSDGQLSNVRLTVGSGLSAGALYTVLYNGNSSAYLGLGAEL